MPAPRSIIVCHLLTVVDGESEELVDLLEIKEFPIERFHRQFAVPVETDPDMLERYAVGPDDVPFLIDILGFAPHFDFQKFAYFIEAAEKDVASATNN